MRWPDIGGSGVKVAKAGLVDILERPVAPLQDVPDFAQLEPGQAGICRGSVEDGEPIKIMMCVVMSIWALLDWPLRHRAKPIT